MFQKHRGPIVAMSNGECLRTSTNQVFLNFCDFCLSSFLPIFSNSQGVENSTKDTENCAKTGREEATASIIHMIRSCMISSIILTKKDPDFMNMKRSNMHARECFNNKCFTSNMLDHAVTYCESDTDQEELDYYKKT